MLFSEFEALFAMGYRGKILEESDYWVPRSRKVGQNLGRV